MNLEDNETNDVDIQKYVDMIDDTGYLIFGKDQCKYCTLARDLLMSKKIREIQYIKINNVDERKALYSYINDKYKRNEKTVPQIFEDGEYIGGYTSLKSKIDKEY